MQFPLHIAIHPAMDRRTFLRAAGGGILGLSVVGSLTGCGGDDDASTAEAVVGGELDFFGWQGEDLPGALGGFATANSITVKANYMGTTDDIDARFASGGAGGIDILSYTSAQTAQYLANKRTLTALDLDRIPNYTNLLAYFRDNAPDVGLTDADGDIVMIPHSFGAIGITYDSAQIDEPPSWESLLAPELSGRITMVGDPASNFALATRVLGIDPVAAPKDRMEEIAEFIAQFVRQSKTVAPSWGDVATLLASGEVVACYVGWAAVDVFATFSGSETIRTNIRPAEGTFCFLDGYGLAQGADNADTVYAWMNEVLDPTVNGKAANELVAGGTVAGAVESMDSVTADLYPYDEIEAFFETAPVLLNPPVDSDEFITIAEWIPRFNRILTES